MVHGMQTDFRRQGRLIRGVDTGKILQLTGLGLGIEPLWVPADTFRDGSSDKYFDEFLGCKKASDHFALGAIRRNERTNDHESALGHQFRHLASAPDILYPVGLGKPKIAAEAVADIVAIEQHRVVACCMQPLLQKIGYRRFAGARKSRQPKNRRFLMLDRRPLGLPDHERLPAEIGAASQPECYHAGADGLVREAISNDKQSGLPVLVVSVERDRR